MIGEKSYYEILNISENSSEKDIKEAYRKLIKVWHPDLHPGDEEAVIKTQEINEAYGVLSDPEDRVRYDRFLSIKKAFVSKKEEVRREEAIENEETLYEEVDYHNMTYKEYCEAVAKGARETYQQSKYAHADSNEHKEYVYKKERIEEHPVLNGNLYLIMFPIMMLILASRMGLMKDKTYVLPLVLIIFSVIGVCFELVRRRKSARKAREAKTGGIDSVLEADRWFDLCRRSDISLSDCRKAFFTFSVKADKYLLQRFNMMKGEERQQYSDIIELLEYVIEYRER